MVRLMILDSHLVALFDAIHLIDVEVLATEHHLDEVGELLQAVSAPGEYGGGRVGEK